MIKGISIVIPVYNEAGNVAPLAEEVIKTLDSNITFEIIFVDDASTDNTLKELHNITLTRSSVTAIHHATNQGQSSALKTGVEAAQYEWIATLDGDRQNNPQDLLSFISRTNEQLMTTANIFCIGWRVQREDGAVKKLSSKIANCVRHFFLNDNCPDSGCGIKLFRHDVFLQLPKPRNYHRYLPALFKHAGATTLNIPVDHRERTVGQSKYGIHNRLWVGIIDLIRVSRLLNNTKSI